MFTNYLEKVKTDRLFFLQPAEVLGTVNLTSSDFHAASLPWPQLLPRGVEDLYTVPPLLRLILRFKK